MIGSATAIATAVTPDPIAMRVRQARPPASPATPTLHVIESTTISNVSPYAGTNPGWIALFALVAGCATVEAPPEGRSAPAGVESVRRSPLTEPPGALLADVTQASILTTICVPGWTGLVRPSSNFTQGVKLKFLREASINRAEAVNFELDHFVPLALGGHPRSIDNLWLQRWDGPWSARAKDRLERRLQVMVCAGRLTRTLTTATHRPHDSSGHF